MAESSVAHDVRHRLHEFAGALVEHDGFGDVVKALHSKKSATIDGALGSSCALTIAALANIAPGPILVVCAKAATIETIGDDLRLFSPPPNDGKDESDDNVARTFPAWQNDPGERLVYDAIYGERLRTLKWLMANQSATSADARDTNIILSSIQSLLQPVPPASAVEKNTRTVSKGQTLEADDLIGWLAEHGFHGTSGVELPGEFARRGGIVDVFAPDWTAPVRIEWFDDQVESLRQFDIATQRSIGTIDSIDMTILPSGGDSEMRAAPSAKSSDAADERITTAAKLTDYLPENAWIVLVEPDQLDNEANKYLARQEGQAKLHELGQALAAVARFGHVNVWNLASSVDEASCQLQTSSVERFSGDISKVRDELESAAEDHDVYLVCQTVAESKRLREVFADSTLVEEERLHYVEGRLSSGFHLEREGVLLLGGNELFRRAQQPRRKGRKRVGKKIDSFLDLREGDLVVHLVHGIGRYRGLKKLKRENQIEDHLTIEFSGKAKVYVPATKIDLVQKYVGATKARPRLATIGSLQWQKRRKAAESAVTFMAEELLEMQAQRAARPGITFLPDTEWQQEFDSSFPYDETNDQLVAIDNIKSDMEKGTPMDRLLCGDVGFGKTEVSIRAAFKAVDNGYQVAVLVPTTVLAEQHYRTFKARFSEFPFEIARLSRFCSRQEEREIVAGLKEGAIDIVIGTHRIASKDVRFQNLGLLVIDEEQRFGVQVKERLKSIRATVDVLTMTATPIPRTLHMAMVGMRDISNLETPPEERIAVETRVARWDDNAIRSAILRELNRGGQVYFVHNRVHDIHSLRAKLEELVPEASIRVGHGQMPGDELEEVMVGFVNHDYDVLLATTIVESGLDIPNANTIFIDDADNYGLSDLHQLRGRVGRYKHRAYCYLVIKQHKHITPEAARRLRAIEEFSQMGAGFAIAMRDLEFRGAGNVLGTQQSGHIAAVGYELYCDLLDAAVRRLKKMPPKLKVDVNIDLPGEAFIPDDYVPDLRMKIDLYRRMTSVTNADDLESIRAELNDRFGSPPDEVLHLLALTDLKIEAAVWQVDMVKLEDQDGEMYLVFEYTDAARIRQLAASSDGRLRVVDQRCAYAELNSDVDDPPAVLAEAKLVLQGA